MDDNSQALDTNTIVHPFYSHNYFKYSFYYFYKLSLHITFYTKPI